MRRCVVGGVVWLWLFHAGVSARGDLVAIQATNTSGETLEAYNATYGWRFTPNSGITVTQLGLFDGANNLTGSDGDGFTVQHTVGLFDNSGHLLAGTVIGSGQTGTLVNNFRYLSLSTPVVLTAGQTYRLGVNNDGNGGTNKDPALEVPPNTATPASEIDGFGGATASGLAGLLFPGTNSTTAYLGPNFQYENTPIPEPSSLLLTSVSALALAGYCWWWRRRPLNLDPLLGKMLTFYVTH